MRQPRVLSVKHSTGTDQFNHCLNRVITAIISAACKRLKLEKLRVFDDESEREEYETGDVVRFRCWWAEGTPRHEDFLSEEDIHNFHWGQTECLKEGWSEFSCRKGGLKVQTKTLECYVDFVGQ